MPPDRAETPAATVEEWRQKGEGLLRAGAPIVAYDTLAEGLVAYPGDPRLRQLLALALARTGASNAAIPLLEALRAEGHRLSAGIWTGINAATMALLMGRKGEASEIARVVRDRCQQDEANDPS